MFKFIKRFFIFLKGKVIFFIHMFIILAVTIFRSIKLNIIKDPTSFIYRLERLLNKNIRIFSNERSPLSAYILVLLKLVTFTIIGFYIYIKSNSMYLLLLFYLTVVSLVFFISPRIGVIVYNYIISWFTNL